MSTISSIVNITPGSIRRLVGQKICDAILDYNRLVDFENLELNYVEILENKFGDKIFFNKEFYKQFILFLDDSRIIKLAKLIKISFINADDARNKISKMTFGYRNMEFSENLLNSLGLPREKYLPEQILIQQTFDSKLKPNAPLHGYQKNIKDEVVKNLLNSRYTNRMLIHMPTGSGKTKTAMEIVCDFLRCFSVLGGHNKNVCIVWVAHSNELCEQAYESFQKAWLNRGDFEIDIFKLYGDADYSAEILKSKRSFVIVGFQKFNSLLSDKKDINKKKIKEYLGTQTRLVLVDEAHKSLAGTYQKTIEFLTNANRVKLLGLTATPGRNAKKDDKQNNFLAQFFNSVKIGLIDDDGVSISDPVKYLQEIKVLAKIERTELVTDVDIKLTKKQIEDLGIYGDERMAQILSDLAINPGRNKIIIDKVIELNKLSDSVLIFACNVEHCIILQTILKKHNITSKTILSDTHKDDRLIAIEEFKTGTLKVLINYGVLTTGFDAPILNSLIIARPTTSIVLYSQMVGRALRGTLNQGNDTNKLFDLKDNFDFGNQSQMINYWDELWGE